MDGASGLGKNNTIEENKTSAEWYVQFMLAEFEKEIQANPLEDIKSIVKKCIRNAKFIVDSFQKENNIKLEDYEIPSASLAIMRDNGLNTELFLLGDTMALVKYRETGKVESPINPNQNTVYQNDRSILRRAIEISAEKSISLREAIQEPEILKSLQNNRSKKNSECAGGYWIAGTNEEAVEHGITLNLDNYKIDGILLASDGLDYSILGLDNEQAYQLIQDKGLDYLVKKIRNTQLSDPDFNKYPRFKMSDDVSAIFTENNHMIEKEIEK